MAKTINNSSYVKKNKKQGLAAKSKSSKSKNSKLYKKPYRGQGK
jgi:hypothetical protein